MAWPDASLPRSVRATRNRLGARGFRSRLDQLDLLPSPFPLEDFLSPSDFRHVLQMFNIGGLSYGNLSARKDEQRFWISRG